jgi:hypothetical protein
MLPARHQRELQRHTNGLVMAVVLALGLSVTVGAGAAVAKPLILPAPAFEPDHHAGLELVAPPGARSCALNFFGRGRSYGPYRISVGGPTRFAHWRVPSSARGRWTARLACRGAGGRTLGRGHRLIRISGGHRARGRIIAPGTLGVRRGPIPDMPSGARVAAVPTLGSGGVNIDDSRPGFTFGTCPNGVWMDRVRTIGDGVASEIQFQPTANARANALEIQNNLIVYYLSGRESYDVYGKMWAELNRCATFPGGLDDHRRHALYEQMACHARYGIADTRWSGGNTWDLEAWRREVPWDVALDPKNKCQSGDWGSVRPNDEPVRSYLTGMDRHLVHSSLDEAVQLEAWLVAGRTRRPVHDAQAYFCLTGSGIAPARLYPGSFLQEYLATPGPKIFASEACGSSPTEPKTVPTLSISGSCTTAGGTLSGASGGFTPGGTATIRAWYPSGAEYTNLVHTSRVRDDGSIGWSWPCEGDPAGTYTSVATDDTTGAGTGSVSFTIGTASDPGPRARVDAYSNYGGGAAGHAMCRGNPARPESMPGGTASQTFTIPQGIAVIDAATVQIDPDASVTAHATLYVNGAARASTDSAAAGDTNFSFPAVGVGPGDQATLAISFTASYGKIITVYTVGSPGGIFTASNSCSDGAPSFSTGATGLRATVSGWNR